MNEKVVRLEKEWRTIETHKGDDDLEKYLMGVAYNNIVENALAQAAGYKSAAEFITAKLKEAAQAPPTEDGLKVRELSVSTLSNYASVARVFDVDAFSLYGYTNLLLLTRYRKLVEEAAEVPLDQLTIDVPGKDGETIRKPFRDCSSRDLLAAMRALRPSAELSEDDQDALELLNLAVDVVVGTDIRCDVKGRYRNGKLLVSLDSVPFEQLEEVLWSMLDAMPGIRRGAPDTKQ